MFRPSQVILNHQWAQNRTLGASMEAENDGFTLRIFEDGCPQLEA